MLSYTTIVKRISFALACTLAIGALFGTVPAHALQPIKDIVDAPITGNPSLAAVKGAIMRAGAKRNWAMKSASSGHIQAMQNSRGLMARVEIKFSRTGYSITYHSSDNLKYKEGGKIHKRYNQWVSNLSSDIQSELFML